MAITGPSRLASTISAFPALLMLFAGPLFAENEVALVAPSAGEEVGGFAIIEGTARVNDDSFVWVMAHRKDLQDQWWPQDEPKVTGDQWKAIANIGGPQDIGHEFEIAVATFGPEVKEAIDRYFEIGREFNRWLPMSFPKATSNVDIVTVKKVGH